MGKRSNFETPIEVLHAFTKERTWKQSDLAKHLHVKTETVRDALMELQKIMPSLERQEDRPHVYWSVPTGWHPAGVVLEPERARELIRELGRAPETPERNRLLDTLLKHMASGVDPRPAITGSPFLEIEAECLAAVEDGATSSKVVEIGYFSQSRGEHERSRLVSPQRILPSRKRLVMYCHKAKALRWFLLENVTDAHLLDTEPYVKVPAGEVDAFIRESADGFHGDGRPQEFEFTIHAPHHRWALRLLPVPVEASTEVPGGRRIKVSTTGAVVLARFLLGLGSAVTIHSPTLKATVLEMAKAAAKTHAAP